MSVSVSFRAGGAGVCALLAAMVCGPVLADDAPSFDCAKADGEAQTLICSDPALAALDRRLADRFSEALAKAEAAGADAVDTLRATQRGWIGGRDECWKADNVSACIETAYLTREAQLVAMWRLEPPTGQDTWVCERGPNDTVTTAYFETELPSVRLEYDGVVDVGLQARSGSGVRYEASAGRAFAMKGSDATLEWPEGTFQACTLVD